MQGQARTGNSSGPSGQEVPLRRVVLHAIHSPNQAGGRSAQKEVLLRPSGFRYIVTFTAAPSSGNQSGLALKCETQNSHHGDLNGTHSRWLLDLPGSSFEERRVSLTRAEAVAFVEVVRGGPSEVPSSGWTKEDYSRYGEDLVGGWLLKNGGLVEGLRKEAKIQIPARGNSPRRRVDWLLGRRIIVEVKTYVASLVKGGNLSNTRQMEDYSLWRDEAPSERAVVLAKVAWRGSSRIEPLFQGDLRHYKVPVVYFEWRRK